MVCPTKFFKKKCFYLNKGKKSEKQKLYNLIKSLPLSESEEEYSKNYELLIEDENISSELKSFKKRHETRQKWSRGT